MLLWSLDDYWYYSLFTLLMLIVFEATVVKSRMRNTDEMRALANPASRVTALRQGRWVALSSEALLPGDLVSIARNPPVLGEPVTTLLPADILLLHGTAVVNESALTGESTPQRKASLDSLGLSPSAPVDLVTHKARLPRVHMPPPRLTTAPHPPPPRGRLQARAAPTHPGAPPEQLGGLPRPPQPASGRPQGAAAPLSIPP